MRQIVFLLLAVLLLGAFTFAMTWVGVFIGMSLALQTGYQLGKFNQESNIGLIGIAIVKEFGPVITAFLLALAYRSWTEQGSDEVEDDIEDLRIARRLRRSS